MILYLFIHPRYDELKRLDMVAHDDFNMRDVVDYFKVLNWSPYWGDNAMFLRHYGEWIVYQKSASGNVLIKMGLVKDYC